MYVVTILFFFYSKNRVIRVDTGVLAYIVYKLAYDIDWYQLLTE